MHICHFSHAHSRARIRVRRSVHRVAVAAALSFACVPTICDAQESSPLSTNGLTSIDTPLETHDPSIGSLADAPRTRRLGVALPLYASFAALQMLDAHSTTRALGHGAVERNPLLRDLATQPAALYALKGGITASTIFLAEKLRAKHRVGAIVLMVALDSFYATVVVHNYRATR